ncbi:inosine-uridine preferring nucleoside hydrolase [Mollisia scopiformis]|uniref:Inosine-uridine preferring nucleoside hydrolase n=1 Tax=Mollisia scopiformis TaxID=149040 RepID=A0A194WZA1_MOLSC|nr:inosine-uridine preferring nucleoside hydrolase [Mollisia scopiformis]KUJ12922.1 inosine-uridine preferring nucleoside hydrolase [Mollisia scopiformis]
MQFLKPLLVVSSLAASIYASPFSKRNTNEKKYAILDNDWSSAGFIPFLLAVDAGIEVLALTSSTSNSWQKQCAYHALATLEAGNLSCIPVYYGSTYPLINTYERFQAWEAVHGVLPWQGVFAPYNATAEALGSDPTADGTNANRIAASAFVEGFPNTTAVTGKTAAQFMVEQVRKYPGQVSIYAAGAMTNVALAVRLDEEFASLAKELVIMGGYVDVNMYQATGTTNQADINSDINLMIDPEASKIALTAAFPNIIIAGNVANQVISSQEFLDEIYEVKNPYSKLMYEYYGTIFPFWDETAMAILIDPSIVTNATTVYLDVDVAYASPSYGNIHVYQSALMPPNIRNVTYVNTIDTAKFKSMIKHAVQYPKSCSDF